MMDNGRDCVATMHGGLRQGAGRPRGVPNKVTTEVRELAQIYAPDALKELARLSTSARSETARVAAIREILDRAWGKSSQVVVTKLSHATDSNALPSCIAPFDEFLRSAIGNEQPVKEEHELP